ncbi:protein E2A [Elephant endotheliotropic herpesvirus 3A]|uniref:Protein E2A n=1 Tax=Elephant endotheliotropic herpesvirus 3A TaxID=1329409 RepID=A0A866VST8_9BETA|nr:protein E2A [Elephant endotheliotropic herpesvirus 3A]QOE74360.1 protein E2A [Elephant endotheliotropic herpesvirus 3A]
MSTSTTFFILTLILFLAGSNSANSTTTLTATTNTSSSSPPSSTTTPATSSSTSSSTPTVTTVSSSLPSTTDTTASASSDTANGSSTAPSVSTYTSSNSAGSPSTSSTTTKTGSHPSRGVPRSEPGRSAVAAASHSKRSATVSGPQPTTKLATNHSNQVLDGITFVLNTVALIALVPTLIFHLHYFYTAHHKCPYNIILTQSIEVVGCIMICGFVYGSFFWQYVVLYLMPSCFVLVYGCMAVAAFNLILAGNFTLVLSTGRVLLITCALLFLYAMLLFYIMYTDDRPSTLFLPNFEPLCPAKTEHFFLTYAYVQYLLFLAFVLSAFAFGCAPGNLHVLPLFATLCCCIWIWLTYWCGGRNIVLGVFVSNVYAVLLLHFLPETLYLYRKYGQLMNTRAPIVLHNGGGGGASSSNATSRQNNTKKTNLERAGGAATTKQQMSYSNKCNLA